MKKLLILMSISLSSLLIHGQDISFHSFKVKTIDEEEFNLSDLKGKKVLVVNTASKCGHTPQYEKLQSLYEKYKDKNFIIIGFPANNFLKQEPGTNAEIKQFCTLQYNVTFPMMSKISVKGNDIDPLYKWLTTKSENGVKNSKVKWNFQKYMIDENGKLVDVVLPKILPNDEVITNWIEGK